MTVTWTAATRFSLGMTPNVFLLQFTHTLALGETALSVACLLGVIIRHIC